MVRHSGVPKLNYEIESREMTSHCKFYNFFFRFTQLAVTCSKLTIETLEQDVKYVQS